MAQGYAHVDRDGVVNVGTIDATEWGAKVAALLEVYGALTWQSFDSDVDPLYASISKQDGGKIVKVNITAVEPL